MKITFEPLNETHFPLILEWLESPHVKKWWDRDVRYTIDSFREKYGSYVKGYKKEKGVNKEIHSYVIILGAKPIGYIQLYNAYDFERSKILTDLPENLGAFDVFIGEEGYLGQNLGVQVIREFLELYGKKYSYIFVDPDCFNIAAIKCYQKAGFKIIRSFADEEVWMLKSSMTDEDNASELMILNSLTMREPIFHHPEKFGRTKEDIEAHLCEDFSAVDAFGNIYFKEDVIKILLERYNDPNYQDTWEARDFEARKISSNNYLLTYSLIQNNIILTRRSTIWRKDHDVWKICYHQGTLINKYYLA